MKHYDLNVKEHGFYGVYYPCEKDTVCAMILMLGDSSDDLLARTGARWVHDQGIAALCMSPAKKDYGHHSYPLERFGKAIQYLKHLGYKKIGIVGASTTGMMALLAASYYPEITLTIAMTPPDFVMEGFYRDKKDGADERPGDFESSVTWEGKQLPFLPYAYRHPEYWQMIQKETKETGNMTACRNLFDESERRHPVQEEEKIPVERIRGELVLIGAEDDVLWDTCRYIRRMQERLSEKAHECNCTALLYEHGTHFVFPEGLLKKVLPFGDSAVISLCFKAAKEYPRECLETRKDIDAKLKEKIASWKNA